MDKLFLLDAYALIYRSYYAFIKNPRINSKGLNTSAIMGFCNTLNEVLEKEKPTHIGVAFDPHGPTFRNEAYPAYKAQREETPEDIRASVPIIKDILRAYRIPILQVDGYEADDVIGTLALKFSGNSGDSRKFWRFRANFRLYAHSRQRLWSAGAKERLHLPASTRWWLRDHVTRNRLRKIRHFIDRSSHRPPGLDG